MIESILRRIREEKGRELLENQVIKCKGIGPSKKNVLEEGEPAIIQSYRNGNTIILCRYIDMSGYACNVTRNDEECFCPYKA